MYASRARQLWSFARRLGLDALDAEDVVQEAFLRAGRGNEEPIQDLDAWLFRVVHNLAVDRHRVRRRDGPAAAPGDLAGAADDVDERLAVWQEVDRLPERQRAVVYLHYRAGLDFDTIGAILSISASGARANAARALATLRARVTWR
ncbi:MAG TPA: sigma-70 family RNA polymerase sigma factor [Candidatus Limnocylindrales bacterium]|nr:sigma-70 family RNA polymerase sigma factor [Candidatus Limnocylindrales bacterium]